MRKILYLLTGNRHKVEEIREVAERYGIEILPIDGYKLEIQSDSLEEIAATSAYIAHVLLKKPVLVEDAGLFINALGGFPGPYSSYVYKTIGLHGILRLMEDVEDRRACFKSAAAIVDGLVSLVASGEVCGYITREPRGTGGFGFDPIFTPGDQASWKTFAEMDVAEKNRYSHRARAVDSVLKKYLLLREKTV